ncbi:MAG: hypothetical protein JWL58_4704 [Streptosporangiaceae bacterium]|nr:hypothetical protein [Streptosporangiaceae bacterium]
MAKWKTRRVRWTGAALVVVLALGIGVYALLSHLRPYLHGDNCEVRTPDGFVRLDLEQAANAATIAAVSQRKHLPEQALVIAYATAFQESKIRNLTGGDRDSIGLFQQRPSQGWGKPEKISDPAYASTRFFDALVKIKRYQTLPVHVAAQKVQRSADGSLYAQHEGSAKVMAAGYTGRVTTAVRCWYSPDRRTKPRLTAAARLLQTGYGPPLHLDRGAVTVNDPALGWSVACWAVSHAQGYGLTEVRYGGKRWRADDGFAGWTNDDKAPADRVVIR